MHFGRDRPPGPDLAPDGFVSSALHPPHRVRGYDPGMHEDQWQHGRTARRLITTLAAVVVGMFGMGASGVQGMRTHGAPETGYLFRTLEHEGQTYPYTVYVPRDLERAEDGTARGLLFLHGSGECGTDGSKPLAVGLPPAMMLAPERWPFVVVIPQKPRGDAEWEDFAGAVLAMLDAAIEAERIDPDRVAITGLSQGGHGTMWYAAHHGDRFRAAAPVCGYVQRFWKDGERKARAKPEGEARTELAKQYEGTPVWLLHGGKDNVVPPGESEWLHAALQDAGLESKLTVFPNDNHNAWDSAYRRSGLWEWLVEMTE